MWVWQKASKRNGHHSSSSPALVRRPSSSDSTTTSHHPRCRRRAAFLPIIQRARRPSSTVYGAKTWQQSTRAQNLITMRGKNKTRTRPHAIGGSSRTEFYSSLLPDINAPRANPSQGKAVRRVVGHQQGVVGVVGHTSAAFPAVNEYSSPPRPVNHHATSAIEKSDQRHFWLAGGSFLAIESRHIFAFIVTPRHHRSSSLDVRSTTCHHYLFASLARPCPLSIPHVTNTINIIYRRRHCRCFLQAIFLFSGFLSIFFGWQGWAIQAEHATPCRHKRCTQK